MDEPSEGDEEDTEATSSYRVRPLRNENGLRAANHGICVSHPRKSSSVAPSASVQHDSSDSKASIDCRDESVSQPASLHSLAEIDECAASAAIARDSLGSASYYEGEKVDDFRFGVHIDPEQYDRACEIPLLSTQRPYMRAFHFAWASFFVAFFAWFAITPLLGEIQYSSTQSVAHSNLCFIDFSRPTS